MIHYRDRTFCSDMTCKNKTCMVRFTSKDKANAEKVGLLIAFADYKNTDYCIGYETNEDSNHE